MKKIALVSTTTETRTKPTRATATITIHQYDCQIDMRTDGSDSVHTCCSFGIDEFEENMSNATLLICFVRAKTLKGKCYLIRKSE